MQSIRAEITAAMARPAVWQRLGGGTVLPLSLTSTKKNTDKTQEAPNSKTGAKMSRSCTKLR
jgi:hypothetical protein